MPTIKMVRERIESLYTHTCTIIESRPVRDMVKKTTSTQDVEVVKDQPCRISFGGQKNVSGELVNSTEGEVKLFIAPEIEVLEGSKVVAKINGYTRTFSCSSPPALYPTHNEYVLKSIKEVL